ncbi:MAG: VWA domain-containing protein [Betaproteobacteria bacterium]|nr:VWA domain-containing protein [Betaproteobacteria bacterium]
MQGIAAWNDAITSLQLLQIDPHGFGGVWLKAPFGPVRERWLQALQNSSVKTIKLPGHIDLERLLGGIDLSATLQTGRLHMQHGLLQQAHQGAVCISMAERFPIALVAPITQAMDTQTIPSLDVKADAAPIQTQFGVIALDESLEDDAPIGKALQERLGIWLDLKDLAPSDIQAMTVDALDSASQAIEVQFSATHLHQMQALLAQIQWTHDQALALCATAQGLGIDSLRIPSLALRVACCHAALNLRATLEDEDLEFAARRVLAPRATQWPSVQEETAAEETPEEKAEQAPEPSTDPRPPPPDSSQDAEDAQPESPPSEPTAEDLQEMMVAAALASLPPGMLDTLMTKSGRNSRLHVLATLRAAAPKQKLRGAKAQSRVAIRAEDFHVHRYQQHSSSCLILALDASGSAALQRLAEAKGAVELLLQQSYARRDSVCIVAFRGAHAQLLLPMTRSLVRAKRAMTGLPGGGGTPLALALKMACEQAAQLHRQGVTPILVVLSDGRANVTLQGLGGRAQAQADALQWGAQWRQTGHRSLWIDTSIQPDPQAQNLAHTMGGSYLPMPQVQAQRVANAMDNLRQLAS